MIRNDKIYCDKCKLEMVAVDPETHLTKDFGGWDNYLTAKMHVCNDCYNKIWDEWEPPCYKCNTPNRCKYSECWAYPAVLQAMPYETYYAPSRIQEMVS